MRDNNAHIAQRRALAFDFDGSIYGTIDRKLMDYMSAYLKSAAMAYIDNRANVAQLTKEVTAHVL